MKKTNKILAIILAILMVVTIIPITASAEEVVTSGACGENIIWGFDEETATLTLTGTGEIPDYYEEDDWGGYYCGTRPWEDIIENDVKHVVINEGIIYIGAYAFAYSDSLETVTMSSVKTISADAFNSCVNLKSLTTSNSLKVIGDDAFYKCDKLTYIYYSGTQNEWNHVKIGDHLNDEMDYVKVYPSDYVIYSDRGNGVVLIEDDTITWIFDANSYTLTVSGEGNTFDDYMFDELFYHKTYYRFRGYRGWDYYKYDTKKIVIDNGINYIGNNSFRFFLNATDVIIPLSVTEIGKQSFKTCNSITDVYYAGTEEQWKKIVVGTDNEALLNANIHFNYVECEHNFTTSTVTEPTCINRGYTTHICSICNESYVDSFLEFTECPDYVEVIWPPTCTEQGYIAYECPVCHTGYLEKYLDPTHNYEQTSVTQPTCTTQGYTTYTCTACGKTVKNDYTSSFGHNYGDVVETIAPTCTEKGYTKQVCTRCEYEYVSVKVPALGHSYEVVSTTEPTCTEQGYTTYKCTVCGNEKVDDYVEATGHNVDSLEVTKEPTCTIEGKRTGICSACSEEVTETISRLGHDYCELTVEYEATCTTDGRMSKKCSRCESKTGAVIIPATGHTFSEWELVDDAKCGEYGRFECVCSTCNQVNVMSAPVEHMYESVVTAPTCTEQGYTTYTCKCGDTYVADYVEVDANSHSYTSEITTPATHTTTGVKTFTCICGDTYTEEIGKTTEHTYETVTTPPTCTEQGYTTYTCECGDSYVDDYVNATGHTDNHNDGICDACNTQLCDHDCHKEGITGILWRIINIFNMLFGLNKTCDCGVVHY